MTTSPRPSRAIDGKGRTIRELLAGHKYSIDYYQREYKWQQKQLAELIDDLADKFLESHEEGNERSAVADYGHYFLGSIIISDKDGQKFIIDGQQRLTTLTLLLIFLHHQLEDAEQKGQIADLVFSQKYGKRSDPRARRLHGGLIQGRRVRGREWAGIRHQHPRALRRHRGPVLLAPLRVDDDETAAISKLRIVAAFLDILIHRRIWNWRAIDYSTMQYAMFIIMRDIRGKSSVELTTMLRERLDAEPETFASNDRFRLHGMNGRQIHRLLARMTDYAEARSGQASRYAEYAQRGRKGYEIEHIWADHPERHTDEFSHPSEFQEYRNRIGGLLLLPKSFNASYGDLPYAEKREHYLGQNLLARSLHERAYDHNPGFRRFIEESGLPFREHSEFKKADLDARQKLYQELAEQIWRPQRLEQEVES